MKHRTIDIGDNEHQAIACIDCEIQQEEIDKLKKDIKLLKETSIQLFKTTDLIIDRLLTNLS